MCACGAKKRPSIQNMIQNVGGILPYLKFSYCAFKDQFQAAFSKIGWKVNNESDLDKLAYLSDNKFDVAGQMKDSTGKIVSFTPFSVEKTLMTIDTTQPTNATCSM